ncbi:MAG: lytic murein transglycosylase [Candidatus Paceibacterota bacterium]
MLPISNKSFILSFLTLFIIAGVACFFVPTFAAAQSSNTSALDLQKEQQLQAELEKVLKDIEAQKKVLESTQRQSVSMERDIAVLNTKIKEAQLQIKAHEINISRLNSDIQNRTKTIQTLDQKLEKGRISLIGILKKTEEMDNSPMIETLLSDNDLSDFFASFETYDSLKRALKDSFDEYTQTKQTTTKEKEILSQKKDQEVDTKVAIETVKSTVQKNESQKTVLLKINKNQEKEYQKIIKERELKAAQIRSALFALRDTASIPFGDALSFANAASKVTGVRPAYLLAILMQESSLGVNVGTCILTDLTSGSGISTKSGRTFTNVMKPSRDIPYFISITKSLGKDPLATKVSCPQSVGWGGAMGPAQFIPSTWDMFSDRIANALGIKLADPWRAQDAFMASALYLSDMGAVDGSYTKERNAACKYYSGSSCSKSSLIASYGDQVIAKAKDIQTNMIDPLEDL